MLLQVTARRRSIVFLDFLVPRSLSNKYITYSGRHRYLSSQQNGASAVFHALKEQISLTHGLSDPHANIFNGTLVKLRSALTRNDIQEMLRHWRHLERNKLLHFLNVNQLDAISKFLAKSFSLQKLDSATIELVKDVALLAAVSRSTDALNTCMLAYLKRNEAEAVIELYRRFIGALGDQDVWLESEPHVDEDRDRTMSPALIANENPKNIQLPYIPGRVNLLLAVTAAHTLQNSFQEALKTCLATVIRFHNPTTKAFLKNFAHDPNFQHKLDLYVKRLHVARMVARPPSLSKQITNLARAKASRPLEQLYQAIMDGLSGPDAYLAPDPSAINPQKTVALTEVGWTSFLVAFLKCRRQDLASKIWTDMTQLGVKPGVSMWTALIDAYDSLHAVDDAIAGWNMMTAQGIKPDGLTYRALISTLFGGRRSDDAMKTFHIFQQTILAECSVKQARAVYNTVLHGLLSLNRVEEAKILLQNMEQSGPAPDLVSYNTFMAYYGRRGDFKALASIVNQMASLGVAGDVFSFSTILSALLKVGRDDASDMVLSIMKKQGIEPNVATYSAIIDHQMRERDERNLGAALRILHQMEHDPTIQPNEVTYTSILAGLYRGQWLTPERAEEWRQEIVERMKKYGVEFNLTTYHILMKACLEYPHPEGLENALAYYREMAHRNITPVHTTWYILLAGLLHRGEWAVADELINDMFISGAQPSGAVLELVSRIRRRTGK